LRDCRGDRHRENGTSHSGLSPVEPAISRHMRDRMNGAAELAREERVWEERAIDLPLAGRAVPMAQAVISR
jgi:hypothetical protein